MENRWSSENKTKGEEEEEEGEHKKKGLISFCFSEVDKAVGMTTPSDLSRQIEDPGHRVRGHRCCLYYTATAAVKMAAIALIN